MSAQASFALRSRNPDVLTCIAMGTQRVRTGFVLWRSIRRVRALNLEHQALTEPFLSTEAANVFCWRGRDESDSRYGCCCLQSPTKPFLHTIARRADETMSPPGE